MGRSRKGIHMTTGRTRKGGDPNAIKSFRIDLAPSKSIFKKQRRRKKSPQSDTWDAVVGWLGGIFILLPIILFFIYLLPVFFGLLFVGGLLVWLGNKTFSSFD